MPVMDKTFEREYMRSGLPKEICQWNGLAAFLLFWRCFSDQCHSARRQRIDGASFPKSICQTTRQRAFLVNRQRPLGMVQHGNWLPAHISRGNLRSAKLDRRPLHSFGGTTDVNIAGPDFRPAPRWEFSIIYFGCPTLRPALRKHLLVGHKPLEWLSSPS